MLKKFWIAVLIISSLFFIFLCLPNAELYFGWDMPFVNIDMNHFTCYGYEVPNQKQVGFMMLSSVLMMAPAGSIPLAINKLMALKKQAV